MFGLMLRSSHGAPLDHCFLAARHGAIYPCFCVSPSQWLSVPLAPSNCSGSMSLAGWHLLFATAWPTWHLTSEVLELTLSSASACCPFFSLLGGDIYQLLGLAHACVRSFRNIAVIYRVSRVYLFAFVRVIFACFNPRVAAKCSSFRRLHASVSLRIRLQFYPFRLPSPGSARLCYRFLCRARRFLFSFQGSFSFRLNPVV